MFRAEEDYLKTIYKLTYEENHELVSTSEISKYLDHSLQSVNEMIKKLQDKNLVVYTPYYGVKLSEMGLQEALRMVRAHRVWEIFLTEKLGFSWDEVHEHAEQLEHTSSEMIIDRLYDYLGKPEFCQHGNPIPKSNKEVPSALVTTLLDFNYPEYIQIIRIKDSNDITNLLNYLSLQIRDTVLINSLDIDMETMDIEGFGQVYINAEMASSIYAIKARRGE